MQSIFDRAALNWISVLPIEIKSNWKRDLLKNFQKCLTLNETNIIKRVFCNKIRRLSIETIKQLAEKIKTLVPKAYSLNTQDYKNTKMTEILMMT